MATPITIIDETALRAAIVADISTITLTGNIFPRRRLIQSRADFIAKLGTHPNAGFEVRFLELDLINVENSDEGPIDCPAAILTYNLHLFHQFADGRPDGSNSDRDFTDTLLRLRALFLSRQEYNSGSGLSRGVAQIDALTAAEFTQFGNDGLIDCVGHSKDLTLKLNYYVN